MKRVTVAAPAKVNLTLHVTGRRADGYHFIDSLVAFAGVFDHVTVQDVAYGDHEPDELVLSVTGSKAHELSAGVPALNLALRAAAALRTAVGMPDRGAVITLHKELPVAAGLGGGSADAAATLRGLTALWDLTPSPRLLRTVGVGLGADVAVCLHGRASMVSGIGDVIGDAPPLPPAWLALVNPGTAVATADVFAAYSDACSDQLPLSLFRPMRNARALAGALNEGRNDLTATATALAPEIARCLDLLKVMPQCLGSRMSGSGATCWGLFATERAAEDAVCLLRKAQPTWWMRAAPLLTEPVGGDGGGFCGQHGVASV